MIAEFYTKYFLPGSICTDSRKIKSGDIFVALSGDNFNGNSYALESINKGAKIAVIDDSNYGIDGKTYLVKNSLDFLKDLAQYHRSVSSFHVIGLTGTNGKTTTKELIKAVIQQAHTCIATEGNLNNHIGVPLTLLGIPSDTDFAIIEMGANHRGEIKELCAIAQPHSGLITNIGAAHLEGFGSLEGVKKTKEEIYEFLKSSGGRIYYNDENSILKELIANYQNVISFNSPTSHVRGIIRDSIPTLSLEINFGKSENTVVQTNLFGDYNFENIMMAVCIGTDLNISMEKIKTGIENYNPTNNRSQIIQKKSFTLLLDCYNANPSSMNEAIKSFAKISAPNKIAILGGMKELGNYEQEEHEKIGLFLEKCNFSNIILVGYEFRNIKVRNATHIDSVADLADYFKTPSVQGSYIMIKGSRANKLEKILDFIEE